MGSKRYGTFILDGRGYRADHTNGGEFIPLLAGPNGREWVADIREPKHRAEFIVRALNAHDDLLEACKRLMAVIEDLAPGVAHIALKNYQEFNEAPIAARVAIAAAEQGSQP